MWVLGIKLRLAGLEASPLLRELFLENSSQRLFLCVVFNLVLLEIGKQTNTLSMKAADWPGACPASCPDANFPSSLLL